jgi:hypothetical protein
MVGVAGLITWDIEDVAALHVVLPDELPPKDPVIDCVPTARLLDVIVAVSVLLFKEALPMDDPLAENVMIPPVAQIAGRTDAVKVTGLP